VAAFAGLAAHREDLELVIAGDGPEAEKLRREAAASGVGDRIRFSGHVQDDLKRELLHLCDLLVIPSVTTRDGDAEGLPVVLLEGLSAGRICLATEASGAGDVLTNGRDGFLLSSADAAALAAGMKRALALSAEERGRLGREAKLTAARYDWGGLTPLYFDHLFAERCPGAHSLERRTP
jgi:glycosyltransferase involved in cell wall biosynthesis